MNTMKDLDQSIIDLGIKLCEDYNNGQIINEAQGNLLNAIIRLYEVTRNREPPNVNKTISKSVNK